MIKHILSAAVLAAFASLAGACAQFDGDDLDDTAIEWPTEQTERIWVEGESVVIGDNGGAGIAAGACACTTPECFQSWVVDSFGCDICVSFVCDGVTVAHACSACEEDTIRPSDSWNGDGRFDN